MGPKILAILLFASVAVAALWTAPRRWPEYSRRRWTAVSAIVVLVGLPVALLYGKWTYAAVRCGRQPVAVSDFAGSSSYWLPGDPGYSRRDLFRSYVCTESEMQEKGSTRSPR